MALPAGHLQLQALAPGGAIGQAGEGVAEGLLPLFFQMAAILLGLALHAGDALGEGAESFAGFLLAGLALALLVGQAGQQAFQATVQRQLEAVQVRRLLHLALQFADLAAQSVAKGALLGLAVLTPGVDVLQTGLEGGETLIEAAQVELEFALPGMVEGQHQHRQVIEHGYQFVPVQAALDALAQVFGLGLVAVRQRQVVEQPQQGGFQMRRYGAVAGFGHRGQGIGRIGLNCLGLC